MKASVRDAFVGFTSGFEGVVPFMYLDVKGLVTLAIGDLVDHPEDVAGLPFVHADGTPASRGEIVADWYAVKARRDLSARGGVAYKTVAKLRLTPEGVAQVVQRRLDVNWTWLAKRFTGIETWPADAQLGMLSMAWAAGPAFVAPKFEAACKAQDWITASKECHLDDSHNPGLRPRNLANAILFQNAAAVLEAGADPEILRYPDRAVFPTAGGETGANHDGTTEGTIQHGV